jgi:hypothetical protein
MIWQERRGSIFWSMAFRGRGIMLKMMFTEPVNAGGIRAEYRQIWRQE